MTLARRLHGAAWAPAVPLVATGSWSLTGTAVAGRIRRAKIVELDGWRGRVELDGAGLELTDAATGEPLAHCRETRTRHVRTITVAGQTFECRTRSRTHPMLVTGARGAEALALDLPRLRRRLSLRVSPDLDDRTTRHLVALTSAMAVRLLKGPPSRGVG